MTVKQLMAELAKLPGELEVLLEDEDNVVMLVDAVEDVPRFGDYQCAFATFRSVIPDGPAHGPLDSDRVVVLRSDPT